MEQGIRLILCPPGASLEPRSVRDFIDFAGSRGIDLNLMQVVARGHHLTCAMLPVINPGRTALLLTPGGASTPDTCQEIAALAEVLCATCRSAGVHLAQALLDPRDGLTINALLERGFFRLAELHYLHAQAPGDFPAPAVEPGMTWITYSEDNHAPFASAIMASYQSSLDCPALNGLRHIDDIIAGHKAAGQFDPSRWSLLMEDGQPIGVLLLNESARVDGLELVYLGLSPAARGRRLGELLLRQALFMAGRHGGRHLSLAVDSANVPALKLYYRHGMQRLGSKIAMLRDLRSRQDFT